MSCDDIIVKAVLMPVCFVVCCCFFIVCFYAALSERIKMYIFSGGGGAYTEDSFSRVENVCGALGCGSYATQYSTAELQSRLGLTQPGRPFVSRRNAGCGDCDHR